MDALHVHTAPKRTRTCPSRAPRAHLMLTTRTPLAPRARTHLMLIMAVQNRSSSSFDSDSVGSIMSVPGTGHDMVGPWKP